MDVVQQVAHLPQPSIDDDLKLETANDRKTTWNDIQVINVQKWLNVNRDKFLPPVANHFMHDDGQLTVMFVGGPNDRTDYHIQCGEEFFYQLRGQALLKLMVRGQPRDIFLREGDIFLLPKRIPHSPQRFVDTMGLVLERKRAAREIDVLRFYTMKSGRPEILYQDSFHWDNAKTDMAACLERYSKSEQCKTGNIVPGLIFDTPLTVNVVSDVTEPFSLFQWIYSREDEINANGKLEIFDTNLYKYEILVFGQGKQEHGSEEAQIWLYQLVGSSKIITDEQMFKLSKQDSLLLPIDRKFQVVQPQGSYLLSCSQRP
ncbi:hypothetical protein HELRODRAFT_185387 [Helobdella robusta]|uniref:3-hydroxyanthranilate 3,4-dioxygenase n=1 Tax=Helobdella robusta TaxID=6412 RepID=T1FMR2_HELRO|nr:hypothetical protein HELRODRAFT_185387 [Helobdella robusta]ESO09044.1 hypothetical protein HELRODRAFT_185387 [Helobdella robusta]